MKQSIPLALLLSTLNGLFCVLANFSLSYPDYLAKKGKKPYAGYKHSHGVWANFMLQNLSEVGSVATWFGPVSLCVPVGLGSMLLLNMLFYGLLVPINHFTKDMRVGTYVIAVAIVLLPVDGPGAQDDQDIVALLTKPYALIWTLFILGSLLYTSALIFFKDLKKYPSLKASLILIASQGAAVVVYNTAAKMFVIVRGWELGVAIAIWFCASASLTVSSMVAAVACDQSKYVPVATSVKLVMNAVTGIIIWEDWRVVGSWTGYAAVFVLLFLGVYLLSTVDIFDHYDTLVDQGHMEALGVKGSEHGEYKPVAQTDVEAPKKGDSSKYGAVSGAAAAAAGGAPTNGESEPTTHPHKVFFRHKAWHMFK